MTRTITICAFSILFLAQVFPVEAGTIVSTTGCCGLNGTLPANSDAGPEVSWTMASTYTNVSIQVGLWKSGGPPATLYLMNQIGAGTTVANQIGTFALPFTDGSPAMYTAFSGLTLGPGSYSLVLNDLLTPGSVSNNGFAIVGPGATITYGTGVSNFREGFAQTGSGLNTTYVPASTFAPVTDLSFPVGLNVTGTNVPEPMTFAGCAMGLAALFLLRKRRSRSFPDRRE